MEKQFTNDELKIILDLLRQVNSHDGNVNVIDKLREKVINLIREM